jgi:hypothetical protein
MTGSTASLRKWFFAQGDASAAAAIRIAFGGLALFTLWDLYPVMGLLLGHTGYFGTIDQRYLPGISITNLLYYYDSNLALRIWFVVAIFATAFTLLGLYTRVVVPLSLFCLVLAHHRNPFMLFGADMVLFNIGLWLLFLKSDRAWSVDDWVRQRLGHPKPRVIPLWPVRVIQIQIALIYLRTALAKLGTEPWQDGSAVYYALSVLGNDVFPQIMHWKLPLSLLTYGTLGIEFSFPFLVFWPPTRWFAILSVVMLHIGIDLLMSIRLFGLVMIAGLVSFVLPSEWVTVERLLRSRFAKGQSIVASWQRWRRGPQRHV